ncbi:pyruvate-formate lyase-activating enzyme [Thermus oshimai JL-2]|uniref:Pyruvate-formate lyase-activating enzyme n=1 Tax=Thermus oshimai JL-2 TaxID=751945 RepID=K7QTF8_THEOS|nr:AmmeMemoRadiSam system radical SAM enzyme [Thermus oshimai]AFV75151.1 pyruvate-formate lyase-activating enzyme [Thermus oshimai JL-2]
MTAALREADLVRPLPKGFVQCRACAHYCAIPQGGAGKCGVRRNLGGRLYLATYGKAAALHVDPVEKKPLFHFHPGEGILSLGTVGCNLFCAFCQNWTISQFRDFPFGEGGAGAYLGEDFPPERVVAAAEALGVRLLAFTYNEPAVFIEYARDTALLAKERGMKTVFVTSGFETKEAWAYIRPYLDAANVDLKGFREAFYREICGARLKPVLESLEHLVAQGVWVEVTTLLLEGYNTEEGELRAMARFLKGLSPEIPWHLTAAHPDYRMPHLTPTRRETLLKAYEIAKEEGMRFVYLGNILDEERSSTRCPDCGRLLLKRRGYRVEALWTDPGVCPGCGRRIPGVWSW